VAILSSAIIFLLRSYTTSLSSTKFSQDITLACYLAADKLWEIESDYGLGLRLPEPKPETIQSRKFDWKYGILDSDTLGLKELKLTVLWKENVREKEYPIDCLTYLITW
jgi:hypothetical protein